LGVLEGGGSSEGGSSGGDTAAAGPTGGLVDPPVAVDGRAKGTAGGVANQGQLQLVLHGTQDRAEV
jgi:hypothetical protein